MSNVSIDLTTFVNTLFQPEDGEVVCLARPGAKGYHQYPVSKRILESITKRPGEWYVCVSTVRAPAVDDYQVRRRKVDCTAAWLVLMDDIGTKVTAAPIDPSFITETSRGNFQYGYLIEPFDVTTPEGVAHYDACVKAMAEAGYGDKGAGEVNRVFRVPGSINTKEGRDNWATRVVLWEPERIYTLDGMMTELGLTPHAKLVRESKQNLTSINDPVMNWLSERGFVDDAEGDFYTVRCPWAHDHTDGVTTAGYSPLGHGLHPLYRVFNCFHEHCQGRTSDDFLGWVEAKGGPNVHVSGVGEIEAAQLSAYLDELDASERSQLLQGSLPPVRKSELPDVSMTTNGIPAKVQLTTAPNIRHIIKALGVEVLSNMQLHTVECGFSDANLSTLVRDANAHARSAVLDSCERLGIKNTGRINDCINLISQDLPYSPAVDWIRSAKWDDVDRFEELLATLHVLPQYEQAARVYLRRWLIQTMQAMHNWQGKPKVIEHVLVLSGITNAFKTTWFTALMPAEFTTTGIDLGFGHSAANERDVVRKATLTPIVELGELERVFSQADMGHYKSFLSQTVDTYRTAYDRTEVSHPRTTSYMGTVEKLDFLVDPGGSRRFWPLRVITCDSRHGIDMQQLWSQVYTWWAAGEQFHLSDAENDMRIALAGDFQQVTPVAEQVQQWMAQHTDKTTVTMNTTAFLRDCLDLPLNILNRRDCKAALEAHLGAAHTSNNIRNSWPIPMQGGQTHIKGVLQPTMPEKPLQ